MTTLDQQREQVAYFMRRLYRQGLTSCSGGNISLRADGEHILVTPSALDKGELKADEVVVMTPDGKNLTPELNPTIEVDLHLETFRRREDVRAVVHAHPVFATTLACLDMEIIADMTPETMMTIRRIAKVAFHPAGTRELALAVAETLSDADVAIMRNHGVATVGPSMLKAFDRLEVTEISAKMTFLSTLLNKNPSLERECKAAMAALL